MSSGGEPKTYRVWEYGTDEDDAWHYQASNEAEAVREWARSNLGDTGRASVWVKGDGCEVQKFDCQAKVTYEYKVKRISA